TWPGAPQLLLRGELRRHAAFVGPPDLFSLARALLVTGRGCGSMLRARRLSDLAPTEPSEESHSSLVAPAAAFQLWLSDGQPCQSNAQSHDCAHQSVRSATRALSRKLRLDPQLSPY